MKKSLRLFLTGSVQGMFFEQFLVENAKKVGVKGYLRKLEDGRMEIFIEGDSDKVDEAVAICKRGTQHTQIRHVEEKPEKFQDFKEFKVLKI
ncbi:MAG: acylphosphatase [Nanoarchaeota archaeon]|nr:acylphosphatase [Nanoarchaeota archaeon]MBU1051486.1 acylphosphatase [Nanoarchaeota archaeon]MBU1988806.1 acylphosphatase [Nanoarchaeota archaeon]